jgi:lysine 2,3-aminomutase
MKVDKRQIALNRAAVLKSRISDYIDARKLIPKGLEKTKEIDERKKKIMSILNATRADFVDWHWQLKNRIKDVETLKKILPLSELEIRHIEEVSKVYRWAISPYYLTLINPDDMVDPTRLMSIPSFLEMQKDLHNLDPMGEEFTNPAGSITRRYPDRLIINTTNECAMYCRHCQRRRNIGDIDKSSSQKKITESIEYIKNNEEIRDVLITGGDPLTLPNETLEWILKSLRAISHVEIIRIGSRMPVTLPYRITDKLVKMLKKYHPLYLNTHFNHPMEITEDSKKACEKLSNAGIIIGNQVVLLNGINNDKFVMRCLNQELLKIRVRPYYIFHAKTVKGTSHFNTSIDDGIEIMEYLRGYTSGMAIPYYIVNAPNGLGKTPILPEYIISRGKDSFTLRTWENEVIQYENHPSIPIIEIIQNEYKKKG